MSKLILVQYFSNINVAFIPAKEANSPLKLIILCKPFSTKANTTYFIPPVVHRIFSYYIHHKIFTTDTDKQRKMHLYIPHRYIPEHFHLFV